MRVRVRVGACVRACVCEGRFLFLCLPFVYLLFSSILRCVRCVLCSAWVSVSVWYV